MPSGTLGKYEVHRTLGSGASCKVKLGVDTDTGHKVAIKIMKSSLDDQSQELVVNEIQALESVTKDHPNIIQLLDHGVEEYTNSANRSKEVQYMVLELANGGELFDFIDSLGSFEEPVARYFYKQFLDGLGHCHQGGVCHRDLKPENLLLDHDYVLKIADFGFAGDITKVLQTQLGTLNYMAPEIHLKAQYEGEKIDLFASAVILFIMVSEHPPFTTAQPSDPFYRCLAAKKHDMFWKAQGQNKEGGADFFSAEFRDLFERMVALDPTERMTMDEVLNHPWMQGPVASGDEVYQLFSSKMQAYKDDKAANREQRDIEKQKKLNKRKGQQASRGGAEVSEDVQITEEEAAAMQAPTKEIADYERLFKQNTEFFSSYGPDLIEEALLAHLEEAKTEVKVSEGKYKYKFQPTSKNANGGEEKSHICARILRVGDNTNCLEFVKLEGANCDFHKHYGKIKAALSEYDNAVPDEEEAQEAEGIMGQ